MSLMQIQTLWSDTHLNILSLFWCQSVNEHVYCGMTFRQLSLLKSFLFNTHIFILMIKALNVYVHQFSCIRAGRLPSQAQLKAVGAMPLSAIMILSTQAALCCTALMGFLLAVPRKATLSWTLITQQALFCVQSLPWDGESSLEPVHLNTLTPRLASGSLTAAKDFLLQWIFVANHTCKETQV